MKNYAMLLIIVLVPVLVAMSFFVVVLAFSVGLTILPDMWREIGCEFGGGKYDHLVQKCYEEIS